MARASSKEDTPPDTEAQSEEENGEEGGEEYEIEKIVDVEIDKKTKEKKYLVRWLGYGPDEDTYVDEEDAANAKDLIEKFWKERELEEKERNEKTAEKNLKRSRSSTNLSEAKRGGRKSAAAREDEDDEDAEPDVKPAAKKARSASAKETSTKSSRKSAAPLPSARSPSATQGEHDSDAPVGSMASIGHGSTKTWSHLIDEVSTVEVDQETQELYVYFTLRTGEKVREPAKVCKTKFPTKLIEFYESHLKWTEMSAGDK